MLLVFLFLTVWGCSDQGGGETTSEQLSPPIVILGIDALDWRHLRPMLDQGKLPNLSRLVEGGAWGALKSLEPRQESPVIWTTIATGKLPEKHGINGYFTESVAGVKGYSTRSTSRKAEALWNIFSDEGHTVSVFSWLVTWPAEKVRGMLTTSNLLFLKPGLDDSYWNAMLYPAELRSEVERIIERTEVTKQDLLRFVDVPDEPSLADLPSLRISGLTGALRGDMLTVAMVKELVPRYEPEVAFIYLRGLDETSHMLWHYSVADRISVDLPQDEVAAFKDALERYYEFADETCGELLSLFPSDARIVVCSDHGFSGFMDEEKGIPGIGILQHGPQGVVILNGSGIESGEIYDAAVEDIAPTVLYMAGYPVGADMDGRVLREAFSDEYLSDHAVEEIETYDTGEPMDVVESDSPSPVDKELKEKLKTLGYIQ
jgi:predicted AlkP superfamily pyrophosphatase or phosphodiesterase